MTGPNISRAYRVIRLVGGLFGLIRGVAYLLLE